MYNTETLFESFTGAASADAGNAPLDAQAIGEMIGNFFSNTEAVARSHGTKATQGEKSTSRNVLASSPKMHTRPSVHLER